MTERRDLKRRVRERQARTGESYMTALRHVQEQRDAAEPRDPEEPRPTAIPTVELLDLTELGAPLGMKCRIAMFPRLADQVDAAAMLEKLRDALLATEGDRAFALMRAVVLRGERARVPISATAADEARRFVTRAKAGIGGISEGGRMLALQVPGRAGQASPMLLFILQLMPDFAPVYRAPTLMITSLDGATIDPLLAWAEMAP